MNLFKWLQWAVIGSAITSCRSVTTITPRVEAGEIIQPQQGLQSTNSLSSISEPRLRALMLEQGNPSSWQAEDFSKIERMAEVFCSDCHTAQIWYGDSSTLQFYKDRSVIQRLETNSMPSPATTYSRWMEEAKAAGFDYRAAMIKFVSAI